MLFSVPPVPVPPYLHWPTGNKSTGDHNKAGDRFLESVLSGVKSSPCASVSDLPFEDRFIPSAPEVETRCRGACDGLQSAASELSQLGGDGSSLTPVPTAADSFPNMAAQPCTEPLGRGSSQLITHRHRHRRKEGNSARTSGSIGSSAQPRSHTHALGLLASTGTYTKSEHSGDITSRRGN
ncbi:unnamed protein product [Pleuronectes platessa]|uniref:Uncharacterized protein n=1 Tax=Pleuronectes platessa TaxID=8262 RepID=A0A9N7TUC0_PLEPL|nr:unnamed protein product [Pleuronectes platessa]